MIFLGHYSREEIGTAIRVSKAGKSSLLFSQGRHNQKIRGKEDSSNASRGGIVLFNLALRAHQTITIQQSTIKLRDYSEKVLQRLGNLVGSATKLEKLLRTSDKFAKETLDNLNDTIAELKRITTHIESSKEKPPATQQIEFFAKSFLSRFLEVCFKPDT